MPLISRADCGHISTHLPQKTQSLRFMVCIVDVAKVTDGWAESELDVLISLLLYVFEKT